MRFVDGDGQDVDAVSTCLARMYSTPERVLGRGHSTSHRPSLPYGSWHRNARVEDHPMSLHQNERRTIVAVLFPTEPNAIECRNLRD
jgi:hypothetical protein